MATRSKVKLSGLALLSATVVGGALVSATFAIGAGDESRDGEPERGGPTRVKFGSALGSGEREAERPHARAEILRTRALVPGAWNDVPVAFRMDDGWHVYADTHNDTGFATKVSLTLPEGWEAGPVKYPAPKRYISPGDILDHVYEGVVVLFVPVRVPEEAAGRTVELTGGASWLVCKEACIPGEQDLRASVTVAGSAAGAAATEATDAPEVATSRARLPETMDAGTPVRVAWTGSAWEVVVSDERGSVGRVEFYPLKAGVAIADALGTCVADNGVLTLIPDGPGDLAGIVEWTPIGAERSRVVRVEAARGGEAGRGAAGTE